MKFFLIWFGLKQVKYDIILILHIFFYNINQVLLYQLNNQIRIKATVFDQLTIDDLPRTQPIWAPTLAGAI